MTAMTEQIELSYRKHDRILPKRKIPILNDRNISTDESEYGKENQYYT